MTVLESGIIIGAHCAEYTKKIKHTVFIILIIVSKITNPTIS